MPSLAEEFDAVAGRGAARPAVVEEGVPISYGGLRRWSEAIAEQLERQGTADGSRVALVLPNSAAFVASFFGAARAGGVIAPLNAGYRSQELGHYLADIGADAIIVAPGTAAPVVAARDRLVRKPALLQVDGPDSCETLAPAEGLGRPRPGDDGRLLLYTSGSTGPPKRVVRTDAQLLSEVETLRTVFALTARERVLGATPFAHVNGLVRSMLTALLAGASLYAVGRFAPRSVLRLINRERLTYFGGVPPMFALLAGAPPREAVDLSSLRILFSASAPLVPEDNRRFQRAYGLLVRQLYGSTETGTISYDDRVDAEDRLESVGRPLPGVSLAVLGEGGVRLPPGNEGETAVTSPFAAARYEGNAAATRRSFRDGSYLTGDLGRLDPDGYLTLTGRKGLIINRGGYKVNPVEVEEAIRRHPKVTDVAVTGAPGPHGDQIVRCLVVASESCSPEELVLHCRERIADYKIPSRIEFRERLPRTLTGKLLRGRL